MGKASTDNTEAAAKLLANFDFTSEEVDGCEVTVYFVGELGTASGTCLKSSDDDSFRSWGQEQWEHWICEKSQRTPGKSRPVWAVVIRVVVEEVEHNFFTLEAKDFRRTPRFDRLLFHMNCPLLERDLGPEDASGVDGIDAALRFVNATPKELGGIGNVRYAENDGLPVCTAALPNISFPLRGFW